MADFITLQLANEEVDRLRAENKDLRAEIYALNIRITRCIKDRDQAWDAFQRLRRAYAMIRYPTLTEEIKLLYDTADAVAAGKDK